DKLRRFYLIADEIGGDEREALALVDGNAGTVDAGAETSGSEIGHPVFEVGHVRRRQAAPLFDVQKNKGAGWEALAARCGDCESNILGSALKSVRLVAQLAGRRTIE